jgi:hypothetical protein
VVARQGDGVGLNGEKSTSYYGPVGHLLLRALIETHVLCITI